MTTLDVVFSAGSLYEREGRYGTMHLMEHLICGTFSDLRPELTKRGIAWNATTGDEYVKFYWTGLESQLSDMKDTLVRRVTGDITKYVTNEEFEKERSTVYQEYCDAFNDPQYAAILNHIRKKFNYYCPIGKREDIFDFTYEDMVEVKKEFFMKPACIIEVGPTKTDIKDVEYEEKRHKFKKLMYRENWHAPFENTSPSEKYVIGMLSKKLIPKKDYPAMKVAVMMLNNNLESPLYKEIREKRGLSYYSVGDLMTMVNDSICMFYAATTDSHIDELVSVYADFFRDTQKYISRNRYEDIISNIKINEEKREVLRYANIQDLERKGMARLPKDIGKVTYENVLEVVEKYLNLNNLESFVI